MNEAQSRYDGVGLSVRIVKRLSNAGGRGFTLDVDFSIRAGVTILFGTSGAGKTTLLDCIAGLVTPDEGAIIARGIVLFDSARHTNIPPHRRAVGYLFQSLALFPHLSVEQNVQYGLASLSPGERRARASEILDSFHIAGLARRRPGEISGGERQRVALGRALVTRPRVLLLDEPLTALDAAAKARIVDDLRTWNEVHRTPILYVTHEREEVFALGDRIIAIEDGRIVAQGLPQEVLRRPQLESVAQLAGFENIFECAVTGMHPPQGTMTCRIAGSQVDLEVPLTRVDVAQPVRVGIRAGDILIASSPPQGLSARNVVPGLLRSLQQRDVMVIARVDCGVEFEVHLTPGAIDSLQLSVGNTLWLVVKTYSCHVLQPRSA